MRNAYKIVLSKIVLLPALFGCLTLSAQDKVDSLWQKASQNNNIHFLLRSSLEIPFNEGQSANLKLNEARMAVSGQLAGSLTYRFRVRLNRTFDRTALDNASAAIDHAMVEYEFGKNKNWAINIGKQANNFGSWEFDKNPTFEYLYSDYVNFQQNIFTLGSKLSYKINQKNTVSAQVFNTMNTSFSALYANTAYLNNEGLTAAKMPVGVNLTWRGDLLDDKFQTFYSLTTSSVAKGKNNYQIALGNKFITDRWEAYLDLQHTNMAVDFVNRISPAINIYSGTNVFAQNKKFQSAILRIDYLLSPKWNITGKTIWERINDGNKDGFGNGMSTHNTNLLGLEFKPVASQDFKIFGYYSNTYRNYNSVLKTMNPSQSSSMVAVGMLYYLKAL